MVELNNEGKAAENPFADAKAAKEERKSKNELQRLRNIAKAKNIKIPKVGLPTKEHFADSQQLSQAMTIARTSTASLGKFQDRYVLYCIIIFFMSISIYFYILLNNLYKIFH